MLVAVFVMYVILAILYESYLHPLTVLSSLPVALVGGLLMLWLFGAEASLYAYIGMFMLMGIVKKNGIMIVDFAEARVHQGIRAGYTRVARNSCVSSPKASNSTGIVSSKSSTFVRNAKCTIKFRTRNKSATSALPTSSSRMIALSVETASTTEKSPFCHRQI
jgi:hypothetical protein